MASDGPNVVGGPAAAPTPVLDAALDRRIKRATSWFFWVAALSFINGLIAAFGGSINFIFGLGITQIVDGFTTGMLKASAGGPSFTLRFVNLGLDAVFAGLFVMCGVLGRERKTGVYIGGMVFYVLDAGLLLMFQSWLEAAFHAYVLWRLWDGLQAIRAARAVETDPMGGRAIS